MQKLIMILAVASFAMGAVSRVEAVAVIPEVDLYTDNPLFDEYPLDPTTVVLEAVAFEDYHGNLYAAAIEVTPEPATIIVLGLGGFFVLSYRHKTA